MTNPNDPAFSMVFRNPILDGESKVTAYLGLTKREYFAAMMAGSQTGVLAEIIKKFGDHSRVYPILAENWVAMADALIVELNREENHS